MTKPITIGQHRGRGRLWLEGAWLTAFGFTRGETFVAIVKEEAILLRLTCGAHVAGNRRVSGKTKGGTAIPVIDINAAIITPFIGPATVTGRDGQLCIRRCVS